MPDIDEDARDTAPLYFGGDTPARVRELAEILEPGGRRRRVPIAHVDERPGAFTASGEDHGVRARLATTHLDEQVVALDLEITRTGAAEELGLRFAVELPGTVGEPRWLIPGCFYRENRPAGTAAMYPRAVLGDADAEGFESPWWSFRSDRAATPVVFGWTDRACVGLATDPVSAVGMHGLGFGAVEGAARIWVDLPYREEPMVYRGAAHPSPSVVTRHRWEPGETLQLRLLLSVGAPVPHAYDPLLRACYQRDRDRFDLAPWMGAADGAELTAHGLHAWHWRPEHDALFETAAFDRAQHVLDRPTMHVAWVSGVPWAHSLLAFGRRSGDDRYVDAGIRVIDLICSARTPAGTFWGEWRRDRGWGCGWNRDPDRLHARTLAEATLFTLRAVRAEARHAIRHAEWEDAARDNLSFALASQAADGNLGSYYHQATGEVEDRAGAAGLLWIAALVEGAEVLGQPEWLDAARRAGHHYARFVEDAFVHGAPEDVHLAPTSEDAYNAVIAYVRLHEADPDPAWLELAQLAANWTMTFRWSYNVEFDPHTILHTYDFRSRGADNASPPNQHLHAYGLIALEELALLWRATGDHYYLDRARDNLACFLQLIARADGDFNAGKGMVTERYYHTDCFQPKGSILTLSHAWCVGVTLLACQVALDDPEAFPADLASAIDDATETNPA